MNGFEKDKDLDATKLNQYFKTKVNEVSMLVSDHKQNEITSEHELFKNDIYSDWKIRLYEGGKLTWWKDASLYQNATATDQILYNYNKKFGDSEIRIDFPIINSNRKNIKRKYIVDADCDYMYQVNNSANYNLEIQTKKIGIYPSSKNIDIQVLRFLSILFILLFFFIYIYLFHLFDFENFKSLFVFYVLSISFRFLALAVDLFGSLDPLNTSSDAFLINVYNPTISDSVSYTHLTLPTTPYV